MYFTYNFDKHLTHCAFAALRVCSPLLSQVPLEGRKRWWLRPLHFWMSTAVQCIHANTHTSACLQAQIWFWAYWGVVFKTCAARPMSYYIGRQNQKWCEFRAIGPSLCTVYCVLFYSWGTTELHLYTRVSYSRHNLGGWEQALRGVGYWWHVDTPTHSLPNHLPLGFHLWRCMCLCVTLYAQAVSCGCCSNGGELKWVYICA